MRTINGKYVVIVLFLLCFGIWALHRYDRRFSESIQNTRATISKIWSPILPISEIGVEVKQPVPPESEPEQPAFDCGCPETVEQVGSFILKEDPAALDSYIKRSILKPPQDGNYKFTSYRNGQDPSQLGQSTIVLKLLNHKRNGFFLDTGANEGEKLSNTLLLEKEYGWTGLLVEPGPKAFQELYSKKRVAWTANVALGIHPYPEILTFYPNRWHAVGSLVDMRKKEVSDLYRNGVGSNVDLWENDVVDPISVTAIPLANLLRALNVTTIDYWSLDVESKEMEVLQTVPFEKFTFKVITLEHAVTPGGLKPMRKFLESKGYILERVLKWDAVFIHSSLKASIKNEN